MRHAVLPVNGQHGVAAQFVVDAIDEAERGGEGNRSWQSVDCDGSR